NFIHRKTADADIYFLANARKEARDIVARFRVSGKQPELWNSEKGTTKDLVVFKENGDGTISVPLQLGMEESVFIVFKKPVKTNHLTSVKEELEQPKLESLSNLEIVKAEYGTFLQEGLVDITKEVNNVISNGKLDFKMSRAFCDCDPAMGYKKEFRMEYQIGKIKKQVYAEEREHIEIHAGNKKLTVLKAVFGKFKAETKGIPENYKTFDITDEIKNLVASETYDVLVSNALIDHKIPEGDKTTLKITYKTDGEERTLYIPKGQTLKLSKDTTKSKFIFNDDVVNWVTPYSGKITYQNALGETKIAEVTSIPEPIDLSSSWQVVFQSNSGSSINETFNELISWSNHKKEAIQHFAGTATYIKEFKVSDDLLQNDIRLELDLGSVAVIAEVIVNGKKVGTLWKAPFRTHIDGFVKNGTNTIEVKVTNLWPNKLIGDERLPLDYERKGNKMKKLPEWLLNNTQRPSERTTFPSWKHWSKNDELLTSGLLGPVKIISSVTKNLNTLQ
ncbi:glycosylhydrolase-like jelly roll fold domain-containing protein, partial [Bacteroidota bacterium]